MRLLENISRSRLGVLLVSAALFLSFSVPSTAFAYFSDYSAGDPFGGAASRSQDSWNSYMASMGEVIMPGEVPDGTYTIDAMTTSTMCWLYPSASECSGRIQDPPWCHCTLTVSDGTFTVHFYLSQAYTHLRWGTAAEAAAAVNADGTGGDGYIFGSPSQGYVPHYFALQIPALNWPMDIATYGGNDADFAGARWWHRFIAFKATDEVYAAMSGTDPTPAPSGDSTPGGGSGYSGLIDDINDQIAANQGANGTAASQNGGAQAVSPGAKRGVVITGVTFDTQTGADAAANAPELSGKAQSQGLSLSQILTLIMAGAVLAGILLRSVSFALGKKR